MFWLTYPEFGLMNLVPFLFPFIAGCVAIAIPLGEILRSQSLIFVVKIGAGGGIVVLLAILFYG